MKYVLWIVATLFLVVPAVGQTPEGCVRVYVNEDADQMPDAFGSGALISPTQVLTNWHVVKDRRRDRRNNDRAVEVRFPDGSRSFAAVVQQDETWDVALLQIHKVEHEPFPIGKRPDTGDEVTVQGFGWDYEYKPQTGLVSDTWMYPSNRINEADFFQVDKVRARQGDSGGPMTDPDGNLVGILYGASVATGDKSFTHGTTIDRIRKVFGSKFKPSREAVKNDNDGTDYILRGEKPDGQSKQQLRNDQVDSFRTPKAEDRPADNRIFVKPWRGRGSLGPGRPEHRWPYR